MAEVYCPPCGGMVNEHGACPNAGKGGCVIQRCLPLDVPGLPSAEAVEPSDEEESTCLDDEEHDCD